jgi:hypothetical protein
MAKHYDVKGREYSPALPGDTLCRTCQNNGEECTWPGRSIVICMKYDKHDPGQSEIAGPRAPEELLRLSQERKKKDSILEDSIR